MRCVFQVFLRLPFFTLDLAHFAHLALCAAAIRSRAATESLRLPRLPAAPLNAAIARLSLSGSFLNCRCTAPTARFCNYPCVCGTALDELRVQNSKMNTTLCGSLNSRGEDGRSVQGQCYANRLLHLPPKKRAHTRIGGVA